MAESRALELLEEMRRRRAEGLCAMPGCENDASGFCDTCAMPVIGFWPVLPPPTRRLLMTIIGVMLSVGDARPMPSRLLWWRPEQSATFVVQSTDGLPALPPYFAHLMTFGPEPRRRRGRASKAANPPREHTRDRGIATLRAAMFFN